MSQVATNGFCEPYVLLGDEPDGRDRREQNAYWIRERGYGTRSTRGEVTLPAQEPDIRALRR
jgi:hypothetical protein